MEIEELIAQSREAYSADPDWLGSGKHRQLIRKFVKARAPMALVNWAEPGEGSSTLRFDVDIERPIVLDGVDFLRLHAELVLHEVLHLVHTDQRGMMVFEQKVARMQPDAFVTKWYRQLFQWLEDARTEAREHVAFPANDAYVRDNHEYAAQQVEDDYVTAFKEQPWTANPANAFGQLRVALGHQILLARTEETLAPVVAELIAEAIPIIQEAEAGTSAAASEHGAVRLLSLINDHMDELQAAGAAA